jgi:hypothetical protein
LPTADTKLSAGVAAIAGPELTANGSIARKIKLLRENPP